MTRLVPAKWPARWPVQWLPREPWARQQPTYRDASPPVIEAAVKRAEAQPSGNWFVFAASRSIGSAKPVAVEVGGVELVAWRRTDGTLRVGPGACPHLGAPLAAGKVDDGQVVCRWHGLAVGDEGRFGWLSYPSHDDGVLCWVRLDQVGREEPTDLPTVPERPVGLQLDAVATMTGYCEPVDVVANRLDPWHGAWFHPYSFSDLRVLQVPQETDDRFLVDVTFRLGGALGVPVRAEFICPGPRTVVMRILEGEGAGSVVETHATPIGPARDGRPRTAVIEATVATSERPGFQLARRAAPLLRPAMTWTAARLWRDDLAYAERRYALRSRGR
ncbi:2Fe-2S ferredoxin [Kribbella sp. ALI-6-A]|nr:2Fe-2S ferredoxin [Kribbella sp. ALI-6-A]